ncbi:hypothetical protein N9744_00745 [bacterium]|nr:hypothetical protein [bacterium]
MTIQDFGADDAADRIDVSGLADMFATPEDLMAALSYGDGQTSLSFDVDGGTSLLTIMSENELDEDDFLF